ncbi:MAG: hypothetical protein ABGZ17_32180 [Planctomycetaceae bacterium]
MKRITIILFCLIGCVEHTPDVCRVAELQAMLSPEVTAVEREPPVLQDRTSNLQSLKDSTEGDGNATDAEFQVGDYCLYDYWRSSPPCPPCIRWARTEHDRVNCTVKQWDTSERPLGWIDSVPAFRLLWCNTETKEWDDLTTWTGFVSADEINKAIAAHKKEQTEVITTSLSNEQLRLTESDLRSWITKHYTQSTPLRRGTVNPKSWVWTHLREDHEFTTKQVGGLPNWMALALHDAVHPPSSPLITPWEITQ